MVIKAVAHAPVGDEHRAVQVRHIRKVHRFLHGNAQDLLQSEERLVHLRLNVHRGLAQACDLHLPSQRLFRACHACGLPDACQFKGCPRPPFLFRVIEHFASFVAFILVAAMGGSVWALLSRRERANDKGGLVFNRRGYALTPSYVTHKFKKAVLKAGLPGKLH